MKERERERVLFGNHAGKRTTAEHRIDTVLQGIGPIALPQQFDRAPGPIFQKHAGTSKLHEALLRVTREKFGDREFGSRVETAGPLGDVLAKQAVGSDDLLLHIAID